MSEPIGWNVYFGDGESLAFDHFEPNEPVLAGEAARFAEAVETFASPRGREVGSISGVLSPEAAEILGVARPRCGALLFPLPRDLLTDFVLWAGEPVHPDIARRCGPVQGPQPAACLLDEGHRIGWHWNNGTWWKA